MTAQLAVSLPAPVLTASVTVTDASLTRVVPAVTEAVDVSTVLSASLSVRLALGPPRLSTRTEAATWGG